MMAGPSIRTPGVRCSRSVHGGPLPAGSRPVPRADIAEPGQACRRARTTRHPAGGSGTRGEFDAGGIVFDRPAGKGEIENALVLAGERRGEIAVWRLGDRQARFLAAVAHFQHPPGRRERSAGSPRRRSGRAVRLRARRTRPADRRSGESARSAKCAVAGEADAQRAQHARVRAAQHAASCRVRARPRRRAGRPRRRRRPACARAVVATRGGEFLDRARPSRRWRCAETRRPVRRGRRYGRWRRRFAAMSSSSRRSTARAVEREREARDAAEVERSGP